MKKTYQTPNTQVVFIQTTQLLTESLGVYTDVEITGSEILSREDDFLWDE